MTALLSLPPVPARYRGVWRRTLLKTAAMEDVSTVVFWLQTARWHADIRIPARRGDFSGVSSLAECDRAQLESLACQQGFAGITQIDANGQDDICRWHRLIDYQPPASLPDVGAMRFSAGLLIEQGVCADYLEHWVHQATSEQGALVLRREEGSALRLLLVAGPYVMHARARRKAFPSDLPLDTDLSSFDDEQLRALLDFEIAFGLRTDTGWTVQHATLPWLEGKQIAVNLRRDGERAVLDWDGASSVWQIEEWFAPDAI
ncbi:hypothetical protein [uncultured Oxalicibacterium sp.]|uniref:hypothetical protein n=1 Tax=uncultured Oxalicibacterium sp. TaxID=1168540 RepID=UPI0025EE1FB2|nr:hypothetical protein [uncultured Oxalicibacterium sp.]